MIRAFCALLSLPLFVTSLNAIVIRHDRDDARYREMGAKFPAVGAIGRAGEGTLIGPEWVLTAAHVATGFRRSLGITFDTGRHDVADVIAHPDWVDGGPHDVALIRLTTPVRGITPLTVFTGDSERGATVTFVGRGGNGDGLTGPTTEDRVRRAATNVVERVDDQWLFFTFDEPPAGTELEGISGPGDSGGPALMERDGKWFVVGVSVWGRAGKHGRGTYGAQEGYTRVSRYVRWIERTVRSYVARAEVLGPRSSVPGRSRVGAGPGAGADDYLAASGAQQHMSAPSRGCQRSQVRQMRVSGIGRKPPDDLQLHG